MTVYDRDPDGPARVVDRWDAGPTTGDARSDGASAPDGDRDGPTGAGWQVAPEETGRRTSHVVRGTEGRAWLLDPLDAPCVDDLVRAVGDGAVGGVAVCADYHARDAAALARRYDVPVLVPDWLERVPDRLAGVRVERVTDVLGTSGFSLRQADPHGWAEAVAYRPADGTLYVPDLLGTAPGYAAPGERLGVVLSERLFPPRATFAGLAPDRVLVGHGTGVFDDASAALSDALTGARRRLPRLLPHAIGPMVRGLWESVRE